MVAKKYRNSSAKLAQQTHEQPQPTHNYNNNSTHAQLQQQLKHDGLQTRPSLRWPPYTTIFNAASPNRRGTPRNNPVEGARKTRIHPSELLPKNQVSVHRGLIERKKQKIHNNQIENLFSHNNNQRRVLPPTRDAAQQHGRGDHAKFAFVWANCCSKTMLANRRPNWEKKYKIHDNQPLINSCGATARPTRALSGSIERSYHWRNGRWRRSAIAIQ